MVWLGHRASVNLTLVPHAIEQVPKLTVHARLAFVGTKSFACVHQTHA